MRFPFRFYKAGPADYVVKFVSGKRTAEGKGRWFFIGPRTTIARIPATDLPQSFAFTELTADGQQVIIQGELQVRLKADRILERRDFTVDAATNRYLSNDPDKVGEEVAHALQSRVRREVQDRSLKDALTSSAAIETSVLAAVRTGAAIFADLGVEVVNLFVTGVAPANPDLKKALEAEARERMLAGADKAVAERRQAAAASDRSLKEYEADTTRLLEVQRAALLKERNTNLLAEAEADAEAVRKRLTPYRDIPASTLLALGIREIATSGRVGQFNITPEILAAIARTAESAKE